MNDDPRADLLKELLELGTPPRLEPGDVTLKQLADLWGITRSSARRRLDNLCEGSDYETLVVVCPDGKNRRIYRRADTED